MMGRPGRIVLLLSICAATAALIALPAGAGNPTDIQILVEIPSCGDGVLTGGEVCDFDLPGGDSLFCGASEACSADCSTCHPIPEVVEMGLSDTVAEGILLAGESGEIALQIFDSEISMLLTLRQDAVIGNEGEVCFRLAAGGPCTSTLQVETTGGPDNVASVIVEGLTRSLVLANPLLLNMFIGGVQVRQITVAVVETQIEFSPAALVNDAPAGTINITTLPATADLPIPLAWSRADAEAGAGLIEATRSFNSVGYLVNGQLNSQLFTGADGSAFAELVALFGGQGPLELDGDGPIGLTNADADCCPDKGSGAHVVASSGENRVSKTDSTHVQRSAFKITRTYSSQSAHRRAASTGDVGVDWAFSFITDYLIPDGGNVVAFRDTNRTDVFTATLDPDVFDPPLEFYEELRRTVTGEFELRSANGTLKRYAAFNDPIISGRLIRQEDRNGNFMSFLYDELAGTSRYVLTTAVDSMGRNVEFRYYPVTDPNLGRRGRLWEIEDFRRDNSASGRVVVYDYDVEGNLISVRLPVIAGTPNGNDFPVGKTTRYHYLTEATIPFGVLGYSRERLRHNLIAIEYPNETATDLDPANPQSLGTVLGTYRENFTYGLDPNVTSSFDRVVGQTIGGINANTVPAGGSITYGYQVTGPNASGANDPYMSLTRTDARGNVTEVTSGPGGTVLEIRELTRGFRNNEPVAFVTQNQYNEDKELILVTLHEGNSIQYTYDSLNPDRFQHGNIIATERMPGPRGGDQTALFTEAVFEPIYNQVSAQTDSRGLDPAFVPPIPDACGRTVHDRYTQRFFYDYQEAPAVQILPLLADELSISEAEVQLRLDAAGVQLGLGDLNGDGDTSARIGGNEVRNVEPSVSLLAGSNQATIEGDSCQDILTLMRHNSFGQLTSMVDPEGNQHEWNYFPETDPDGDGTVSFVPADGRTLNATTGGYLQEQVRDTVSSPARNNSTDPTPTAIAESYTYDDLGYRTSVTNGRGIRTDFFVNEHHEVIQIARAAAVPGISASEPISLTAFAYLERAEYDFNGNVVLRQLEDRFDTLNTGGFVDTAFLYDILDQEIEKAEEVDITETLIHLSRYDANGNPTLTIAPEGNARVYLYDERDLLFQSTTGAQTATLETLGAPAGPFNPRGGTPSTTTRNYDGNRNLSESVDAADTDASAGNGSAIAGTGDVTRTEYDGYDDPLRTIDAVGNERIVGYDPARNTVLVTQRGPVGGASPSDTAGAGNTDLSITEIQFDELNRRSQIDSVQFVATGVVTQRTPDIAEGPLTPGDGRVTQRTEYDRLSRVTFHVDDEGDTDRADHDGASRVIGRTDPEGNTVDFAYDGEDNVIETRETDVSQVGGVADEIFLTTMFYDSLSRLQQRVDNLGQSSERRYDSRDNLVARADAQGPVTAGTVTRRVFPDGADTVNAINDFGNVTQYFYDGIGRKVRDDIFLTALGQGNGSSIGANLFGVKSGGPPVDFGQSGGGKISTLSDWDGNSLLTSTTDDKGNRTNWTYDNLNRKTSETKGFCDFAAGLGSAEGCGELNSDPTTEVFQYDPDHNVESFTDENGSVKDCNYDAINRLTSCSINRAAGVIGTTAQTYEYDGLSRPTRRTDNNDPGDAADDSVATLAYDSHHRIIEQGQQIGALAAKAISSAWRAENLRTGITYPDGRTLEATYDKLDRLATVLDSGAPLAIAEYDYVGRARVLQRSYPINGTRETYLNDAGNTDVGYDGLRRVVKLRHLRTDQSLIVGFDHSFDRMNNKKIEKKLHGLSNSELYKYDSAYRLIDFERGTLNGAENAIATPSSDTLQQQQWDLNGMGDWTELATTEGGSSLLEIRDHSSFNEIYFADLDVDGDGDPRDRTHDDNGNLTDEDLFSFQPDTYAFAWDHFNRLRRVTRKSDSTVVAVYSYHADGRRNRKVVTNSGGLNGTVDFYYDGWRVIEERDGADQQVRQYVYGASIDELLVLDRAGEDRLFYHRNTLGSIFAVTDPNAVIDEGYQYNAYGLQVVFAPGTNGTVEFGGDDVSSVAGSSSVGNPYMFTGRRLDAETGRYYFRNRYFDSGTGRFLSRDPLGPLDSLNLYEYARSSPTKYVDPMGLYTVTKFTDCGTLTPPITAAQMMNIRKDVAKACSRITQALMNLPKVPTVVPKLGTWARVYVPMLTGGTPPGKQTARLKKMLKMMKKEACSGIEIECECVCGKASTNAYTRGATYGSSASLHLCPGWWTKPRPTQYMIILHEMTHYGESEDNDVAPLDPLNAQALEGIIPWLALLP